MGRDGVRGVPVARDRAARVSGTTASMPIVFAVVGIASLWFGGALLSDGNGWKGKWNGIQDRARRYWAPLPYGRPSSPELVGVIAVVVGLVFLIGSIASLAQQ